MLRMLYDMSNVPKESICVDTCMNIYIWKKTQKNTQGVRGRCFDSDYSSFYCFCPLGVYTVLSYMTVIYLSQIAGDL